jgi:prepilin-type N-terminal cleavage/methylation domain-containing protein/prepilin-type processing-associated H-X9-DG protein
MPPSSFRLPKRGFTLIELLVVIAVLALLAAFLYPILFQGKRRGRQAECQAHLSQLGHAFALYAEDWDGFLPSPGGLYGERNYWDQGSGQGLDAYLRNRSGMNSVWICPEIEEWKSQWQPRTYTMNTFLRNPPDVEPYTEAIKITDTLPLTDIPEPTATLLLFEGTQTTTEDENTGYGYVYRDGDWTQARGYWREPQDGFAHANVPWHGAQNNYLFVDGHVKSLAPYPREPERPEFGHDFWHVNK